MNAIYGRFNFENARPVSEAQMEKMLRPFDYSPGASDLFLAKGVGLGIKGLYGAKAQLASSEDGSIIAAFEGSIDEPSAIKAYLLQKGHTIKTSLEGELLIHLFEEQSESFIRKINGAFTLAIWDGTQQRLFLFRDRIGFKSIFYTVVNGAVIFASEIKAIIQDDEVKKEVDLESLDKFLSYNYVAAPDTMFRHIKKLAPAHYLSCCKNRIISADYWKPQTQEYEGMAELACIEKFSHLLKKAVRKNLASGQTGLLLSGGIDSSSIGFFMAGLSNKKFKSFTLGFPSPSYDLDRKISRTVSRLLGTEHHEALFDPTDIEAQALKRIIYLLDDPVADPAVLSCYCISNFAAKYSKIALSGEGADEVLGGYETYVADKINRIFSLLPFKSDLRPLLSSLAEHIPVSEKPRSTEYKIKSFFRSAGKPPLQAHCCWREFFTDNEKVKLLKPGLNLASKGKDPLDNCKRHFDDFQGDDLINKLLYVDFRMLLPDFLRVFDCMGRSCGLEIRFPFLDAELLDFLFRVPSSLKVRGFTTKYLLKKAMAKHLPDDTLIRKKMGFSAPLNAWMRKEWKEMVRNILSEEKTRKMNYFRYEYIEQILSDHFNNSKNNSWKILGLLNFYLWHDIYIENPPYS